MGTFRLACHPDTPASKVEFIEVEMERSADRLWLRFHVECNLNDLDLPEPASSSRCDGLWQQTCFEAFIGDSAYSEFNFSPSSQWAAYDFFGYREGMRERPMGIAPQIGLDASESHLALEATFHIDGLVGKVGLAVVIDEVGGTKSYWALAQPPGAPDFHHPTCFVAKLPAPDEL